jgi:hypothetical protein
MSMEAHREFVNHYPLLVADNTLLFVTATCTRSVNQGLHVEVNSPSVFLDREGEKGERKYQESVQGEDIFLLRT